MDVSDMIKDEDLLVQKTHVEANGLNHGYRGSSTGQSIQQFVSNMVPNFRPRKLSAREVNLLKRKARINAKDQPKDRNEDDEMEISSRYKPSTPKSEFPSPSVVTKVFTITGLCNLFFNILLPSLFHGGISSLY